jgi:hypothetical protein
VRVVVLLFHFALRFTHLSILTQNINGCNTPIQRHRIAKWVKNKTQPCVPCSRLISLIKENTGLESRGEERFFNGPYKQAGVAKLISHKVDLKPKLEVIIGNTLEHIDVGNPKDSAF